jgi:asparagine N-glycosylation enzyme membrane subunit Stt3
MELMSIVRIGLAIIFCITPLAVVVLLLAACISCVFDDDKLSDRLYIAALILAVIFALFLLIAKLNNIEIWS